MTRAVQKEGAFDSAGSFVLSSVDRFELEWKSHDGQSVQAAEGSELFLAVRAIPPAWKLRPPVHDVGPCLDERNNRLVHPASTSPRQRGVAGFVDVVRVRPVTKQPSDSSQLLARARERERKV